MPDGAPLPSRQASRNWPRALAAVGGGAVALAAGLWLLRLPIGEFAIRRALAQSGVASDLHVTSLDFGAAVLERVRLGPAAAPDAAAERIEAHIDWRGLSPRLSAVRVTQPMLHARLDPGGRLSFGALDRLRGAGGGGRRALPALRLTIIDGAIRLDAPMGPIHADFSGDGALGQDFRAQAAIPRTQNRIGDYALDLQPSTLAVSATREGVRARARLRLDAAQWGALHIEGGALLANLDTPQDLSSARLALSISAARIAQGDNTLSRAALQLDGQTRFAEQAFQPGHWSVRAELAGGQAQLAGARLTGPRLEAQMAGENGSGRGDWTLNGQRFSGFGLESATPAAAGSLSLAEGRPFRIDGEARLTAAALTPEARSKLRNAIPGLGGSPMGPALASAKRALDRAARRFDLAIPLSLSLDQAGGRLALQRPIEAHAASGARVTLSPLRDRETGLLLTWPHARLSGAVALEAQGGGLPTATLLLDAASWSENAPFNLDGSLSLADWRSGASRIAAQDLAVSFTAPPGGDSQLELAGAVTASGPVGGGAVRDLALDVDLIASWRDGWRARPANGCVPARFAALDVAGLSFRNGALALCALGDGPLMAADASHRLSGGFFVDRLRLQGRMAGEKAQPTQLQTQRLEGRFSGTTNAGLLTLTLAAPRLAIQMAPDRLFDLRLRQADARAQFGGASWRVDGTFAAGTLADPALPGTVSAIAGNWSMAPGAQGDAVIRVAAGQARVDAVAPPENAQDRRPLFQPVRLADVAAVLQNGSLDAQGRVVLQAGARDFATFDAHHDIDAGIGEAHVRAEHLTFDETFQPFNLSELARGAAANVRGPAAAFADVSWSGATLRAQGRLRLDGVSLSAATIPVIENVRGEVHFDDLFALTTPPGQELTIGTLNPGVAVHDGRVRFQLLSPERVKLESAEFQFAAGMLSVRPATITLGAEETALELTLRDIDVEALIQQLNIKDLTATGTVEGAFPLVLTRRTAFIHGGVLRASEAGGTIAYTGHAGDAATGAARMAFQALMSFRYDDLSLSLDGDLNGELVSAINFSGHNTAPSVEIGQSSPLPGLSNVRVKGVPFIFTVHVTAPFRSLAETAAGLSDARSAIGQALHEHHGETAPSEPASPHPQTQPGPSVDVQPAPLR